MIETPLKDTNRDGGNTAKKLLALLSLLKLHSLLSPSTLLTLVKVLTALLSPFTLFTLHCFHFSNTAYTVAYIPTCLERQSDMATGYMALLA